MTDHGQLLAEVMNKVGMTQSDLARISGVRQPSISQMLSGTVGMSDEQLARMLTCMGHGLEVRRVAVPAQLTRPERRSWYLHRELAKMLDQATLEEWRPRLSATISFLQENVTGEPHATNLGRWREMVDTGDLRSVLHALTSIDRDAVELREVAPFRGLLPDDRRQNALSMARNET